MKKMKFLFPALIIGTGLALALQGAVKTAAAKPAAVDTTYQEINAYIEAQMQLLNIPGVSLAIVEGDQITYLRGFGQAGPDGETPTPQMPFIIGSLSKSFTGLAVMQLVEAGQIELDAPVQHYLPWFQLADPQASAQITVRHLLNQTSGLPTWVGEVQLANFDDSPNSAEHQARALSTLELTRPVGQAFEYSNANYNLLGLVIEAASGESYPDYVQNHVFEPLDMMNSYTSQAIAKQNGLAIGHQYWFAHPFAVPDMPAPQGSLATGQLIASAEDMAHYLIAMLNGGSYREAQVISEAGLSELHRGVAEFSQMGVDFGKYGMGWFVDDSGSTKMLWHSGTTPDFGSFMVLLPEQNKGMILLYNANHHWMVPALSDFGSGVAALLAGEQPEPIPFTGLFPWMLRSLLLVPLLQIIGVVATLRFIRRRKLNPESHPSGRRLWGRHILLPLIPNLLVVSALVPLLGKTRGYLMLYMPDYSWIALLCGGFAGIWTVLRTRLVLAALRRPGEVKPV